MPDSIVLLGWVAFTFLLAGMVKGVVGMGLPTVAMGLLGLVMPPVEAAALLVVPSLVTNIWQLATGPRLIALARRLATMMLGVCAGTFFGIGLLTSGASGLASVALGMVLALYGAVGLAGPRFAVPAGAEPWLSPVVGMVTGVLTGATGVFVIPAVPYLGSLGLEKEELIQALGLSFAVSTIALAGALAMSGGLDASLARGSLLALVPVVAGLIIGQAVRKRLRPEIFRRWFFASLVVLGLYMVARAIA